MNDLTLKISENDKQTLKAVAPLLAILAVFFFAGKFSIAQVKGIRTQIAAANKAESVLSEKLNTLQAVSQTYYTESDQAIVALPRTNPSLQVVSQIKNLAGANLVLLGDIRSSAASSDSTDNVLTTSFTITGPREAITSFIKSVATIAPLTIVDKVEITENQDVNSANISVKTFWADLPTTIPTVTQPVSDLTEAEKQMLIQLGSLSYPAFTETTLLPSTDINTVPFGL